MKNRKKDRNDGTLYDFIAIQPDGPPFRKTTSMEGSVRPTILPSVGDILQP